MGYARKETLRRWQVRRQIANAERRLAVLRAELAALGEAAIRVPPKRPVACGGRRFPSLVAAGRAEGVSHSAIWNRVKRGIGGWRYVEPCDHCGEEIAHEDGCPMAEVAGKPAGEGR